MGSRVPVRCHETSINLILCPNSDSAFASATVRRGDLITGARHLKDGKNIAVKKMMKPAFVQTILRDSQAQTVPCNSGDPGFGEFADSNNTISLFPLAFENGLVSLEDVNSVLQRKELDQITSVMPRATDSFSAQFRAEMLEYQARKKLEFIALRTRLRKDGELRKFSLGLQNRIEEVENRGAVQLSRATESAFAVSALRDAKLSSLMVRESRKHAREGVESMELAEKLGRMRSYRSVSYPPERVNDRISVSLEEREMIRKRLHMRLAQKEVRGTRRSKNALNQLNSMINNTASTVMVKGS